jgi:hypothetical protein
MSSSYEVVTILHAPPSRTNLRPKFKLQTSRRVNRFYVICTLATFGGGRAWGITQFNLVKCLSSLIFSLIVLISYQK